MSVQRRSDADLHIPMGLSQLFHNGRQIALQVNAERQEVWDHQDAGRRRNRPDRATASAKSGWASRKAVSTCSKRSGGGRRFRHHFDGLRWQMERWNRAQR